MCISPLELNRFKNIRELLIDILFQEWNSKCCKSIRAWKTFVGICIQVSWSLQGACLLLLMVSSLFIVSVSIVCYPLTCPSAVSDLQMARIRGAYFLSIGSSFFMMVRFLVSMNQRCKQLVHWYTNSGLGFWHIWSPFH